MNIDTPYATGNPLKGSLVGDIVPLTESVTIQLADLISTAQDTVGRLSITRDRLFGCPPPSPEPASRAGNAVSNSRSDELHAQLQALFGALHQASTLAAELQSRL